MAKYTKKLIKDAFLELLEEKPYTKISVRDIAERCNINRNSFYYHYQDILALLMEIIQEQSDEIIAKNPNINSVEESMNVALEFAIAHKRAVLHIYRSVSRDLLERHFWTVCDYTVRGYLNTVYAGRDISGTDREVLVRYLKAELFGIAMDWLETGMKTDVQASFHRLCEMKKGQIDEMVRFCEAHR